MKTLDEVIKALEECMTDDAIESEGVYLAKGALHYLKEYRMQVDDIVAKRKALEYKSKLYDEMCETIQKQGQEHEDRLQAEIARYQEAVRNCEIAQNKYIQSKVSYDEKLSDYISLRDAWAMEQENPPLTWDELKQMEGKPVWVEERYSNGDLKSSGWWLIDFWNDGQICLRDHGGHPWNEHRSNYGRDWQAYRKEL